MTQTFERRLRGIKEAVADASQSAVDRTTETAAAANHYIRGHPWTAIAIGAAAGALLGFLAAKR
jgi:ElaB/YqjD/DUF883 family membrane-anchored ribosome-binding protein